MYPDMIFILWPPHFLYLMQSDSDSLTPKPAKINEATKQYEYLFMNVIISTLSGVPFTNMV